MSIKTLAISPEVGQIQISVPAIALRHKQEILQRAAEVTVVDSVESQTLAIECAAVQKGLVKELEKQRKALKQPFIDIGKAIDASAEKFRTDLDADIARLEKLISDFQRKEREKVEAQRQEQERIRQAAEQAVERERNRLEEIERQKSAAGIASAVARKKAVREKALAEYARLEQESEAAQLALSEAQGDVEQLANTTVTRLIPAASEGAAIRQEFDFEVTDIEAFYAWDLERRRTVKAQSGRDLPSYVKMEIKRADFKGLIGILPKDQQADIPGIRIFETTKAAVRSVPTGLALR